jgi:MFS family permease
VIFAVYSIGTLISSFWIGSMMGKRGRKKLFVVLGLGTMAVGSLFFIILLWTPEIWSYTLISCLARFIVGFGEGIFLTPAFSLIPLIYKDTFEHKIGIMEAISGFGLSAGPVFGGILY